jgi:hypothetical protein
MISLPVLTNPESLNSRLDAYEWIAHPADLTYFDGLTREVLALSGNEKLLLPKVEEPYAWRRLYALFCALKRRRAVDAQSPAAREASASSALSAAASLAWDKFVRDLSEIVELKRRGVLTPTISEYIGLHANDLSDPTKTENEADKRFGRVGDWRDRAGRVDYALMRLRNITPDERAMIPTLLAIRKLEKENADLAARVAALEAAGSQKEAREIVKNGFEHAVQ